jgi:hypothetical protein
MLIMNYGVVIVTIASSLGKGAASLSVGASSISMPHGRDIEVIKLFIRPWSRSLCLTVKAWFEHISYRSFLKWFIGDRA